MISKERFSKIKKGDILIFKRGRARKAIKDVNPNSRCITFKKVFRPGTTVYCYHDIYKKVVAVMKPKMKL